jgi:hypothetical protein
VRLNTGEIAYVPEDSFTLWPQVYILVTAKKEIPIRPIPLTLSPDDTRIIDQQIFDEKLITNLQKLVDSYFGKEKPPEWKLK